MTKKLDDSPEKAHRLKAGAAIKRNLARSNAEHGDRTGAFWDNHEADGMEAEAKNLLTLEEHPGIGTGGELMLKGEYEKATPGLIDTVEDPDATTARASYDRLLAASEAGQVSIAVDAAESIRAENSLEKMLAHQMASAHLLAMKLSAKAMSHAQKSGYDRPGGTHALEATRLANSAARLMETYQKAMLTLQKLRTGGKQTMVVQHVQVSDGGQAVVAGNVEKGAQRGGDAKK